jgi:hypothetical protein
VVLMFKRYKESGSTVVHWHVESDTQEVRAAIESAQRTAASPPEPAKPDGGLKSH